MRRIKASTSVILPFSKERTEALLRRPKKTKTSPTNQLTSEVINYIRLHDKCDAWRINSTGTYRDGIGFVQNKSIKGFPDVIACLNGRFVGIEIKVGADFQSEDQKAVQARIEASNGRYLIVKDLETFKTWFDGKYQQAIQKSI